ncbi:MAG: DUF1906 domain-containing protein, partial [Solirubrobacterales bacterium]|nr:DUF1906 domain-containing protein [Solirubrobacterales bacterium]
TTPVVASAQAATKLVRYRGVSVRVPASWPVYSSARTCVRFDRHAVYLGSPSAGQNCPTRPAIGRTESILIQPASGASDVPGGGSAAELRRGGQIISATWQHDPTVIRSALGVRSLNALAPPKPSAPSAGVRRAARTAAATSHQTAPPGQVYTGQGFDACSAPSTAQLASWSGSPYHALGVYIGGANSACAQPNLNASWVSSQSAADWHLLPIYVGLQAPSNSCGCQAMNASGAAAQGTQAAQDAVAHAQALGLGAGNPIYDDMEAYKRVSSNTGPVLAFLNAWTQTLHAAGYRSGVYASDSSGVADMVSQYGTAGFTAPDVIWTASWNNTANTADSTVPGTDWANHQRVHQYAGGSNVSYGGTTLNIDKDYVDAPTAAYGGGGPPITGPPVASVAPTVSGTPAAGQILSDQHAQWSQSPSSYGYQWQLCDKTGANCTAVPGATGPNITVPASDTGHTLRVVETAANSLGTGVQSTSPPTAVIARSVQGYWAFNLAGHVFNSVYQPNYGALSGNAAHDVKGMAASPGDKGYWLAGQHGTVLAFGGAPTHPQIHPSHSIIGMAPTKHGGYWLYSSLGNIYPSKGSTSFGSPVLSHMRINDVVGMATSADGKGYWIATRWGTVIGYGSVRGRRRFHISGAVRGITASAHGYWIYTSTGHVYGSAHTNTFGNPAAHGANNIVGLVPAPANKGYWLISGGGRVFNVGAAPAYPALKPGGHVQGLAG